MFFSKPMSALAILALACAAGAQTRTITTYTTGTGSATESDSSQATSEATQQAENWANSSCLGTVTASSTTASGCVNTGSGDNPSYTCTVSVRDTCEVEYRPRLTLTQSFSGAAK
jgi:hypothetical protein